MIGNFSQSALGFINANYDVQLFQAAPLKNLASLFGIGVMTLS